MSFHDVFPSSEAEYRLFFDEAEPQPRETVSFSPSQGSQHVQEPEVRPSERSTPISFPTLTVPYRQGTTASAPNQPPAAQPQTSAHLAAVGQRFPPRPFADLPTLIPLPPEVPIETLQRSPAPTTPTTAQPAIQIQISTSPSTLEPGSQPLVHIHITTSAPVLSMQVPPSSPQPVPLQPPPAPHFLPQQALTHRQQHMVDAASGWGLPTPASRAPLITAEQISKEVGGPAGNTRILDVLSFLVPAGSLFAINGPSGSGKSTLLNILTGIDQPTSGRIIFAGREMGRLSENALAKWRGKSLGIVFQFFQLLPTLTARENILLALELGRVVPRRQ